MGEYYHRRKIVELRCTQWYAIEKTSKVFPDKDFCLYKDFPFDKLAFIVRGCEKIYQRRLNPKDNTCTFYWLTQYYYALIKHAEYNSIEEMNMRRNMKDAIEYGKFISTCQFDQRLESL